MAAARLLLFPVLLLAGLSGCTSAPRVTETYRAAEVPAAPFERVLVVAVARTARARRLFEERLAGHLGEAAVASRTVIPSREAVGRDSVVAAAAESGVDAVLVTRLDQIDATARAKGGRTVVDRKRKSDGLADLFRYDYVETKDITRLEYRSDVVLSTDLYRVSDEARIYALESAAFEQTSQDEVIDGLTRAIARELRRAGMVR